MHHDDEIKRLDWIYHDAERRGFWRGFWWGCGVGAAAMAAIVNAILWLGG